MPLIARSRKKLERDIEFHIPLPFRICKSAFWILHKDGSALGYPPNDPLIDPPLEFKGNSIADMQIILLMRDFLFRHKLMGHIGMTEDILA